MNGVKHVKQGRKFLRRDIVGQKENYTKVLKTKSKKFEKAIERYFTMLYKDHNDDETPRSEMIQDRMILLHECRKNVHFIRLSEVRQFIDIIFSSSSTEVIPNSQGLNRGCIVYKCPSHKGYVSSCSSTLDLEDFILNLEQCIDYPLGINPEEDTTKEEDREIVNDLLEYIRSKMMDRLIQQSRDEFNKGYRSVVWYTRCINHTCPNHKGIHLTHRHRCKKRHTCEECNSSWCLKCGNSHTTRFCPSGQNREDFVELVREGKGQFCPECDTYSERNGGCDKIICPNNLCNTYFCVTCGVKVDPINYVTEHLFYDHVENNYICRKNYIMKALQNDGVERTTLGTIKSQQFLNIIKGMVSRLTEDEQKVLVSIIIKWIKESTTASLEVFKTNCIEFMIEFNTLPFRETLERLIDETGDTDYVQLHEIL